MIHKAFFVIIIHNKVGFFATSVNIMIICLLCNTVWNGICFFFSFSTTCPLLLWDLMFLEYFHLFLCFLYNSSLLLLFSVYVRFCIMNDSFIYFYFFAAWFFSSSITQNGHSIKVTYFSL